MQWAGLCAASSSLARPFPGLRIRSLTAACSLPRRLARASHLIPLPLPLPSQPEYGPQLNFIALPTADPADPPGLDWWVEPLPAPATPVNLYNAFRATAAARLA